MGRHPRGAQQPSSVLGTLAQVVSVRARHAIKEVVKVIQTEEYQTYRSDGEKGTVNLIRSTRMGANVKIDLEKDVVAINRPPLPVNQTVIKKTRQLAILTQAFGVATARSSALGSQQQQMTLGPEVEVGGN